MRGEHLSWPVHRQRVTVQTVLRITSTVQEGSGGPGLAPGRVALAATTVVGKGFFGGPGLAPGRFALAATQPSNQREAPRDKPGASKRLKKGFLPPPCSSLREPPRGKPGASQIPPHAQEDHDPRTFSNARNQNGRSPLPGPRGAGAGAHRPGRGQGPGRRDLG